MPTSDPADADLLVMDTHVWIWASGEAGGPSQIKPSAFPAIEAAARRRRLFVCAASVWEIALKAERGQEHRDPADRFIVTTVRRLNAVLLTCNEDILAYAERGHLRTYDACPC